MGELQDTLAWIAVGLAVATPTVHVLLSAAEKLRVIAATTAWDGDDRALAAAVTFLGGLARCLEVVASVLPHVAIKGRGK